MSDAMGRGRLTPGDGYDKVFGATGNIPATINSTLDVDVTNASSITFWLTVPTGGVVAFQSSADGTNFTEATLRSAVTGNYATESSVVSVPGEFKGSVSGARIFRFKVTTGGSAAGTAQGVVSSAVNTLEGVEHGAPDSLGFDAVYGPMRQMQVAEPYRLAGGTIGATLDASYWTAANAGAGSASGVSNGTATVSSGTGNNGAGSFIGAQTGRFVYGHPHWYRGTVRVTDTTVAENTRRWGAYTSSGTTPTNGAYFELAADGTLYAKTSSGGSVSNTVTITNFAIDTSAHSYEIIFCDCSAWFMVDTALVAQIRPLASPMMQDFATPIGAHSYNSASGATSGTIQLWGAGLFRMGRPETRPLYQRITGAATTALKLRGGRLHRIIANSTGGTSVTLYDNTSAAGTVISLFTLGQIGSFEFGIEFGTGLTVVTVGAGCDVTLVWE